MPRRARRSKKTLPAQRVRELATLAQRIDRDEAESIKAWGRAVKARMEMLRDVVQALKRERLRLGLSLTEVGERSGIGKANLSRLENDLDVNPTISTLMRYADALNKEIRISIANRVSRRRSA